MISTTTPALKYMIVDHLKNNLFPSDANTYVGIGRPVRWGSDSNETQSEIEEVTYTTNYRNQVFRDMVAIKKVTASDLCFVVPRVDYTSNTVFDMYQDHQEIFSFEDKLILGNVSTTLGQTTAYEIDNIIASGSIVAGDIVTIEQESKQIVSFGSGQINVNTAFASTYASNTMIKISNRYPYFANNFYVRNGRDQVFKCLWNNDGAESTVEPTIDVNGQLPTNPYVSPGDGYKWKYLYTIPQGLKLKFFNSRWMPVLTEQQVASAAVDGRIDIVTILDGGSGYYLDGQSGNSNSLPIVTVTGDGSGAFMTAQVESGVITDINIINGGLGYTTATITINDPDQTADGQAASFDTVIGTPGGHGSNPPKELGCYAVMVSVDLNGTESGKIPIGSASNPFDFRQISLIRDPLDSDGLFADQSVYRTTYKVTLTDPGVTEYVHDEVIQSAAVTAIAVNWDSANNILDINNVNGTVQSTDQLTGATSAAVGTVVDIVSPEVTLYSGDLLYVDNRSKIVRNSNQSEQIRVVLAF
jgi:hypothetical protein